MWSTDRQRQAAALDRLSRLAEVLKKIGVTADLAPDHRPFPGLAVRLPLRIATRVGSPGPNDVIRIPVGTVMVLAGRSYFWWQRSTGDLQLVGPLDDPVRAAKRTINHLHSRKRRP
jgi:hypothetical protein